MKMLKGACAKGRVTAGNGTVPGCHILSGGKGASDGVVVLDKDLAVYIAIPLESLKILLEITSALCDQAATISQSNAGGTITPVTFQSQVAALKIRLELLKENLQ